MADQKLTELPIVSDPLLGADQLYLVRGDVSYQMTVDQLLAIIPPATIVWGDIGGTLSNQGDLQSALDAKVDAGTVVGGGLTMNENRILGRAPGTGVGPIGELTLGGGLDLSGGGLLTGVASTLTGNTLAAGIVSSSLTSVGDLVTGSIGTGFVVKGVTMTLGSDAANDIYYRNSSGVLTRLGMGTTGQFLAANTGAAPTWGTPSGAGTVTHTGNLTSNSLVLGNGTADVTVVAGLTTDGVSQINLGVASTTLGKLKLFGNTSGDVTVRPAAAAGTATVVTLPNASSTLPIFGQQITFSGPTAARTIALPDASFTVARTDAANTFTGVQTMTSPVILTSITLDGVALTPEIRQNPQSSNYTLVLADANKQITDSSGSGSTLTWTIPANASVAFPIGTTIVFVTSTLAPRNIAITSDTLRWLPSGGTGTRLLTINGLATAMKIAATEWIITGVGLS